MNAYYNEHFMQFDRLAEVASLIDWGTFRSMIASSYNNLTEKGWMRQNVDCIISDTETPRAAVVVQFLRSRA